MKKDINLLPSSAQHTRLHHLLARRWNYLYWATVVSAILVGITYAGIWWALRQSVQAVTEQTAIITSEGNDAQAQTQAVNQILNTIDQRLVSRHPWTPLTTDVLGAVPNEVTIVNLALKEALADGQPTSALAVSGRASKRDVIEAYRQSLDKLPWVDHIEAPLSNFSNSNTQGAFPFTFIIFRATNEQN